MKPLILFDFDGTIADSLDELIVAFNVVGKRRGLKKKLTKMLVRKHPTRIVMRQLGVRFWRVPGLYREVISEFEQRLAKVDPHEHMPSLVRELSKHAQLGIVSSNSPVVVQAFLKSHKLLKHFPTIEGGLLFGKHKAIRRIKKSLRPSDTLYVGDEVRDILAAKRAGVYSLAVTWGLQETKVLLRARPSMIASSADEAKELLIAWAQSRV